MSVVAELDGVEVARSDRTVVVEGNHYFPADDVVWDRLEPTESHTVCPWKGTASYWTVRGANRSVVDAAWSYPDPKPDAEHVRDRVAFWKGVVVRED